jgi:SpoVK/Ycf46/Vps4 family AAA+-type ATPase
MNDFDELNGRNKSFFQIEVIQAKDVIIKNYLYRLWLGKFKTDNIRVINAVGFPSTSRPVPGLPTVNFNERNEMFYFSDILVIFSVEFYNEKYEICFRTYMEDYNPPLPKLCNEVIINGISGNSKSASDLFENIEKLSIENSTFKNKALRFDLVNMREFMENIKAVKLPVVKLQDLFIPANKMEQIKRFIYSIKNYKEYGLNLRYLLSGEPGTGKTDLINSILNEIEEYATVLIASGDDVPFEDLFQFCSMFNPCVLVIDDIDLVVGSRENETRGNHLGKFLQLLDGFLPNYIFLLATTNDKRLVDKAASRPGRFDLIIDIGMINYEHYLSLILRETDDKEIINCFTKEFLEKLYSKHVSGAFIVSLIKQLKSLKKMKGSLEESDFIDYFNLTHKGFYSSNLVNKNNGIGF